MSKKVVGVECKHATYIQSKYKSNKDALVVKTVTHYEDGSLEPGIEIVDNYQKEFWVTKPNLRRHEDKREHEKLTNLQRFTSTYAELPNAIARALQNPTLRGKGLRYICRSPYVYGADITTPCLIKKEYQDRSPNAISDNTVAVLDIETDVVIRAPALKATEDIISVGITFKNRAFLAYTTLFAEGDTQLAGKVEKRAYELLGGHMGKREVALEVIEVETPGKACEEAIKRLHQWMPDIVAVWNINFDLKRIVAALDNEGYDIGDVFADPTVPQEYRSARYKEGEDKKITSEGDVTPLHPADQWHTMFAPASFYFIDAMCVYKKLRIVNGAEPSYSLDAILFKELGERKLKFKEAEGLVGLAWHQYMQANHKPEYLVYNLFDCMGVELLDEKTGDLAKSLSVQCGFSEYHRFPSQPRRICDDLHFFYLEEGSVIGTTSDKMVEELDKYVYPMTDWIVTLPPYMNADVGLPLIKELPAVRSNLRRNTYDVDCISTYPTLGEVANISKPTTARELCRVRGISIKKQRDAGINLMGGASNAVEIGVTVLGLPTMSTLLKRFEQQGVVG